MQDGSGNLYGDFYWESSKHGGNGWITGMAVSYDGSQLICWADVCQMYKKGPSDLNWVPLITPAKVPAALFTDNYPGGVTGGYHAAFGAGSNTRIYLTYNDRVLKSTDGGATFTNTAIVGFDVHSNGGHARYLNPKGAADPTHIDTYYVFMGSHGLKKTHDGGTTMGTVTSLPAPSHPTADSTHRFGVVAVDSTSTLTSGRHSRVAFAPCGQGIWLSTDGGVTAANITGASGIEAASWIGWINGKLLVCVCSKDNPGSIPFENIRSYNPATSTWSTITTGYSYEYQFIVADPRYTPNGFWAVRQSGDFVHTQNGSSFVEFVGDGNMAQAMNQTYPRERPLVAKKYRYNHVSYAVSPWVVAGSYVYAPVGLGVLRTTLSAFPIAGASYLDDVYNTHWPDWQEDCAGIEEIVGMSVQWAGDRLWCFGQDIPIAMWEFNDRGHTSTVHYWSYNNVLSDTHGASVGPDENYVVARRTREGQSNNPSFSYTDDNYNWYKMTNQPVQGAAAIWESGHGVAGPNGYALCFPTRVGGRPQCTDDYGETPWTELNFWIGATQLDLTAVDNGLHGFQGADFSKNHHLVVHDNANPGNYYAVNIGATTNDAAVSWVYDPLGWAGIYHMAPGDWGNFRRIHAGHPAHTANFAYYDCKLLSDGDGHLFFISNYLPGSPYDQGNQIVRYTISGDVLTPLSGATAPRNCMSITLGAPFPGDDNQCLWAIGFSPDPDNEFGLWYSRDLGNNWVGPFSLAQPGGGFVPYIDAHKTKWGLLAGSVNSRGHAIGRYRSKIG